jgi:ribosomal protein S18 acetylase RimI-like enzyme
MQGKTLSSFYKKDYTFRLYDFLLTFTSEEQKINIEQVNCIVDSNQQYENEVYISIFECLFLFRCKHKKCCEEIKEYWKPLVCTEVMQTPDIIFDIEWDKLTRFLFRSRNPELVDTILEGVYVTEHNNSNKKYLWNMLSPPFPPFKLEILKNKFTGFHGASVFFESINQGAIILGHSGAGKSTLSNILVNKYDSELLTDETVCILNRTNLVYPVPRASGIVESEEELLIKREYSASSVFKKISLIPRNSHNIFILQPRKNQKTEFKKLNSLDAYELISEYHLDIGSDFRECFITICKIIKNSNCYAVFYNDYLNLEEISREIFFLLNQLNIREANIMDTKRLGQIHFNSYQEVYKNIMPISFISKITQESMASKFTKILNENKEKISVLSIHNNIIGFVSYGSDRENPKEGEIISIYLDPLYFRQKYGATLMDFAIQKLKGYQKINLWVLQNNEQAINFYLKFGFEITDKKQILIDSELLNEFKMTLNTKLKLHTADSIPE